MLPNFVLVGFMGCGKSTVGRRLASLTGHRFVDTDDLIVKEQGKSIAAIFAEQGEEGFRGIEKNVIANLVGVAGVVLSTGGGAILQESNRESLKKIGVVIWLDASPDVLFERAMRSGRRPLLQTADPRASFDALLDSRRAIYESLADIRFDSTGIQHEEVARRTLDLAMRHRAR
ncbi:MAG: shikimate kinase [Verrucomicrobiota bacterium]|jgi:shikimate kinase